MVKNIYSIQHKTIKKEAEKKWRQIWKNALQIN